MLDDGTELLEHSQGGSEWYDSELAFDCIFLPDEEGVERCFPRQLVIGALYSDASCTHRVVAASSLSLCDDAEGQYAITQTGTCTSHGVRVGGELPSATPLFFSIDGTSCTEMAGGSDLGPILRAVRRASRTSPTWAWGRGASLPSPPPRDDSPTRRVSSGAPVVAWVTRPTCPADPPLPPGVWLPDEASFECARGSVCSAVFVVAGVSTATTLYQKGATGACEPAEPVSPGVTYLRLGETLGSSDFPETPRVLRD